MDLILETGAGVVGANSYVSVLEADDYFAAHPFYSDGWEALDPERRKNLLISATLQIDSQFVWSGALVRQTQALSWPRIGARDLELRVISSNSVPYAVRAAVCETAYWLSTPDANPDSGDDTGGVTELKVDVIQLKFGGSSVRRPLPVAALRLLRGFGSAYSTSRVRKVQVTF